MSIRRWEQLGAEWGDFRLRPDPDGDWVEYTDHQAETQKAREEAWLAGFDCAAWMANGLTALTASEHLAQFLKSKEKP
jgi:hypothetical protein